MEIVVDPLRYDDVARSFLRKFIPIFVSTLENEKLVRFDPENISEEDISLVYSLCFSIFSTIEDHRTFVSGSESYVAEFAFSDKPLHPAEILLGQRTGLHAGLEDDIIIDAIKTAAKTSGRQAGQENGQSD